MLIANRGEIAERIARAARKARITSIGIYSEADRDGAFLDAMDETAFAGGAPAAESYLNVERILEAARNLRADAIHPGYGFLSERADFAQAIADAGLIFVGPPPAAIAAAGDKSEAKRRARACGVAVIPGYDGEDQSPQTLRAEAQRVGLPLVIKASAGGGGRGIRVLGSLAAFDDTLAAAKREALSGFGDDRVLLERFLTRSRHIEFQILADACANVVHIGERDCSVQRRHQKIIEEAPSPKLTPELREHMGEAAVQLARAVGYVNAGTVEFLLDEDGAYYFLEMNARLQVEHAVTEEAYGIDLVDWQLRIADGEPLALAQTDIVPRGWAIEARVNAEDPANGYLPAVGTLTQWFVAASDGIRCDSGVRAGSTIGTDYDSLLAKLIASAPTRAGAIARLGRAVETLRARGVPTNAPLLLNILQDEVFTGGGATTAFLSERGYLDATSGESDEAVLIAIGGALGDPRFWRIAEIGIAITLAGNERLVSVIASRLAATREWFIQGDLTARATFEYCPDIAYGDALVTARYAERELRGRVLVDACGVEVYRNGANVRFTFARPAHNTRTSVDNQTTGRILIGAPMPGKILAVAVGVGDTVRRNDLLVVLEAMKMEHRVEAAHDGTVRAVHVAPGSLVPSGALLIETE
ncbi:MAG TPA: biotin carboxylase N-terminal domain-containing protein [Candidatus Baltobacteraceae bacterium]